MKIVLLTTARSQRPATVVTLKEQLGIVPGDDSEVSVISWHRPKRPLPVQTNLLVGPSLSMSGQARTLGVADPTNSLDDLGADLHGDLDNNLADNLDEPGVAPGSVASASGVDTLPEPDFDLQPAAEVVRRRRSRAWSAVKGNPAVYRVRHSTRLRKLLTKVAPGGLGWQYALACLSARNVREQFERADVVVALDANTHRAAWLLARLHAGPAVVVGTAAGKRVLAERAAMDTP